ncbi:MAG: hypothetical protein Q7S22_05040 [Candidatus Micrarchaeota archaeon]|nr:hypothetical protein [Candidatus Micrarchaeota archaeon]
MTTLRQRTLGAIKQRRTGDGLAKFIMNEARKEKMKTFLTWFGAAAILSTSLVFAYRKELGFVAEPEKADGGTTEISEVVKPSLELTKENVIWRYVFRDRFDTPEAIDIKENAIRIIIELHAPYPNVSLAIVKGELDKYTGTFKRMPFPDNAKLLEQIPGDPDEFKIGNIKPAQEVIYRYKCSKPPCDDSIRNMKIRCESGMLRAIEDNKIVWSFDTHLCEEVGGIIDISTIGIRTTRVMQSGSDRIYYQPGGNFLILVSGDKIELRSLDDGSVFWSYDYRNKDHPENYPEDIIKPYVPRIYGNKLVLGLPSEEYDLVVLNIVNGKKIFTANTRNLISRDSQYAVGPNRDLAYVVGMEGDIIYLASSKEIAAFRIPTAKQPDAKPDE